MINTFLSNPINKFLLWFSMGVIVCLIGITNVNALENNNRVWFYDNNGSSVSSVTTSYDAQIDESSATFTTTANSYGGLVVIQLDTPLIQNHIYSLFVNVGAANMGGSTQPSTKNCIGIGNGYANTTQSYIDCDITPKYTMGSGQTTDKGRGLYFTFIANTNGTYIAIPYTSRYNCTNCFQYSYGYEITDAGDSTNLSQTQVNTIINNQTNIIENSISSTERNIINNQNQNAEDTQNAINNNLNTCKDVIINDTFTFNIENNFIKYDGSNYVAFGPSSGITLNGQQFIGYYTIPNNTKNIDMSLSISDYGSRNIDYNIYIYGDGLSGSNIITSGTSMPISFNSGNYNKIYIGIFANGTNYTSNDYFTLYNFTLNNYCSNKLDETNNNLSNIFSSLTNTDAATFDSSMINLIPNAPITNLLTIPISLMQSILTRTNNSCSPISIPFLYNNTIDFPCFTLSDYLGDASHIIDMCICFVMIYNILMLFVSVFEDITSLRDEFHTLYAPRQLQLKIK